MKPIPPTTDRQPIANGEKKQQTLGSPEEDVNDRDRPVIAVKPFDYAWQPCQSGHPKHCSCEELYESLAISLLYLRTGEHTCRNISDVVPERLAPPHPSTWTRSVDERGV
jgi:hypothetical protein